MSTNERNQQNSGRQEHTPENSNQQTPQANQEKQWDEKPGQQETDPRKQQQNREWEEAQKQQQQNAQDPGVGGRVTNQSENDRNQDPTRRGENWQEEE